MYNILNQYGIKLLVIIYIFINIYYKNIINVLILLISFLVLRNVTDENNAILFSYILSLLYGISKNFHLLENFKAIVSKKEPIKMETENTENTENIEKTENIENIEKMNKKKLYNVDSIISEELINQFINKIKNIDDLLVVKKRVNIYDLKPTIKNIKKSKLEKMKLNNNKSFLNKPLVISNDNFILDGHHRWFVKKVLIENNSNGLNDSELYNENIKIVMIDYDIKQLLRKLKEFKIKYNENYLSRSVVDLNKIKQGNNLINNIKHDIKLLEENYNIINKARLV